MVPNRMSLDHFSIKCFREQDQSFVILSETTVAFSGSVVNKIYDIQLAGEIFRQRNETYSV